VKEVQSRGRVGRHGRATVAAPYGPPARSALGRCGGCWLRSRLPRGRASQLRPGPQALGCLDAARARPGTSLPVYGAPLSRQEALLRRWAFPARWWSGNRGPRERFHGRGEHGPVEAGVQEAEDRLREARLGRSVASRGQAEGRPARQGRISGLLSRGLGPFKPEVEGSSPSAPTTDRPVASASDTVCARRRVVRRDHFAGSSSRRPARSRSAGATTITASERRGAFSGPSSAQSRYSPSGTP
jgi:hypothetical protein